MTLLLASFLNATIVLALGLGAAALCGRRSAALRHAILAVAIVSATLMPVFELSLPVVEWAGPSRVLSSGSELSADAVAATPDVSRSDVAPVARIPWLTIFAATWLAATIAALGALAMSLVRLARLRARCVPVTGRWRDLAAELSRECGVRRPVALLQSPEASLLVTYGEVAPGILLPAGASEWADDRRRVVLRHELAHIRRHDAAVQLVGEVLRVMQPINPLVWIACRRLRRESEYACDDAVLAGGVPATDYAAHLLEVAKQLSGRHAVWASAPAIAEPSTLERRIVAMLNTQRNRTALTRTGWLLIALLALGVSLPIAAFAVVQDPPPMPTPVVVTPDPIAERTYTTSPLPLKKSPVARLTTPAPAVTPASAAPGAQTVIAGQVMDQSGGVIPGATLTLTNRATNVSLSVYSNASGRFSFTDLPQAEYTLVTKLSGFKSVSMNIGASAGNPADLAITLPIGTLTEQLTINCSAGSVPLWDRIFPVLSAAERQMTPIRVGGQIREPRKMQDVKPVCPSSVPTGETVVVLGGRIGIDGLVTDVIPVPAPATQPPAALIDSAAAAVRQWQFSPTTLNGQPVEVDVTVTVIFKKS
jgi:beta-lactamase regulating signal transducer with metallopeptidase domain